MLLTNLFDAPLRALSDFYAFLASNTGGLLESIKTRAKRRGARMGDTEYDKLAREVASDAVQMVTLALMFKAAQSASSNDLREEVRAIVVRNDSLSYRLIELAILLDSPKDLPRQRLLDLYEQTRTNVVAQRFILLCILNRLYMFVTSESDMQWLNSKLRLDIDFQHRIAYQGKATRK